MAWTIFGRAWPAFTRFTDTPNRRAVARAGYTTPTAIQEAAIPPALDGQDLIGTAQTGTGKTAAFVLPILQKLLAGPRGHTRALILSPTRELAEQMHDADNWDDADSESSMAAVESSGEEDGESLLWNDTPGGAGSSNWDGEDGRPEALQLDAKRVSAGRQL